MDVAAEFPLHPVWLQRYFLNTVFHGGYYEHARVTVQALLIRTQMLVGSYKVARELSLDYAENWRRGAPGIGRYIAAISEWENTFQHLRIIADIVSKSSGEDLPLDSSIDRARLIANRIKHVADDLSKLETGLPLWLGNDGLVTRTVTISYEDLGEEVRTLARVADIMSEPSTARAAAEARLKEIGEEPTS